MDLKRNQLLDTDEVLKPNLRLRENPLTSDAEDFDAAADLTSINRETILCRRRKIKREIRDLRRLDTAAAALAGFNKEVEIFGFTKGQFSIIDIISHMLSITGKADVLFCTWTAAKADVTTIMDLIKSGGIKSARWLVDLTFQKRTPALAHMIRKTFGNNSIRVAKNHAKFVVIQNRRWRVVIRTSMNLNFNPRFENFTIAHDPELAAFLTGIFDEVWKKQKRKLADGTPYKIEQYFRDKM